jgi:hypothetical protein
MSRALGINESCSNCHRVQIIPEFYNMFIFKQEVSVQACILKRQFVMQSKNKLATYSASGITFLLLFRYRHSQNFTIGPE